MAWGSIMRDMEQPLLLNTLHGASQLHPLAKSSLDSPYRRSSISNVPMRVRSFQRTVRALQLDHSNSPWSVVSWIVALLLLLVIPALRLSFIRAADNDQQHKLVFQPLVVMIGVAISCVSFLFLSQTIRRHGFRGILFLDAAEEEVIEIQNEYLYLVEHGWTQLAKLFIPAFIFYITDKAWFYSTVPLAPLPLNTSRAIDLVIVVPLTLVAWIFRTTTYLYTCVLFSKVCALQELKMKQYRELLGRGLDPAEYYHKYVHIIKGLRSTSRRYRLFLAIAGAITVFGALASMYEVVESHRYGTSIFMAGELFVLNLVNLTGVGLCLMSASKVAHLHRRIVQTASSMHAKGTFEAPKLNFTRSFGGCKDVDLSAQTEMFIHFQQTWFQRAALVSFLSSNSAGISVYGFVLDRFFVHTSIGALLTTTWFILGRSLAK